MATLTNVIDWLLVKVLEELHAKGIGDFVRLVEGPSVLGKNVDRRIIWQEFFLKRLLFLALGEDTKLGNVVTVPVRRLRVLWHCNH